jgi:hypothetical protein
MHYSRGQLPDRRPKSKRQEQDQDKGRTPIQLRIVVTLPERPDWLYPKGSQIAVLQWNSAVHQLRRGKVRWEAKSGWKGSSGYARSGTQ